MENKKLVVRVIRTAFLLITAIFLSYVHHIYPAENLDSSFGQGVGYVTTQNAQGFYINDLKIQSDGKIVVVGYTQNPNIEAITARYNTDGSLDATFGTDGIVTANIGSTLSTTVIESLVIQVDGKIVVAGYTYDTNTLTQAFVIRYTTAGVPDGTFGSSGVVTEQFGDGSTFNGVAIDGSGNILVTGIVVINNVQNGLIARFTSVGVLDSSFGSGGSVTELVGSSTGFNALILDGSSNIVVIGYTSTSSGQQALIARYTSVGVLDGTFGSGGVVITMEGTRTVLNALVIDASGNIIVGGFTNIVPSDQFFLARYTSAGVLDASFGTGGVVTQLIGTASRIQDLAIQADGKIIAAGYLNYAIDQIAIARLTSAGLFDFTFGVLGGITFSIGNGARLYGLALQSDGRAVAGGYEIDPVANEPFGLVTRADKNNNDFVTITSITTDSISTKIPIISGTSSAASQQVEVVINGVVFATVATDGSGNWTAGQSSVLPIGTNTIQANLIVTGVPDVSSKITFTVVDAFGEDSVFSYDTTTQSVLTGSFSDVTFDTNAQLGTWSHTAGTASFTCNVAGTYEIQYTGSIASSVSLTALSPSMRLVKNGTEISGSQIGNALSLSVTLGLISIGIGSSVLLTNSVIVTLAAGDVIKVQASGTSLQLTPIGTGTTKPSAGLVITRLA